MKLTSISAIIAAAAISAYAMHRAHSEGPTLTAFIEQIVVPGDLSKAHADLEDQCISCHTPIVGIERKNCVLCHANENELLSRQPTAFHADIATCTGCHTEHRGFGGRTSDMDHAFLAQHGINVLERQDGVAQRQIASLIQLLGEEQQPLHVNSNVPPAEAVLECVACHLNDDRHWGLFGEDCVNCHEIQSWSLSEFRHPPATSTDCSQCHQAPPSHYMMHFKMVSAKVAGKPHARLEQCYECHESTSWNDIKRIGIYKHH